MSFPSAFTFVSAKIRLQAATTCIASVHFSRNAVRRARNSGRPKEILSTAKPRWIILVEVDPPVANVRTDALPCYLEMSNPA